MFRISNKQNKTKKKKRTQTDKNKQTNHVKSKRERRNIIVQFLVYVQNQKSKRKMT